MRISDPEFVSATDPVPSEDRRLSRMAVLVLAAALFAVVFGGALLLGCSGAAWEGIATDAAVCTVERAAEEARRRGDLSTASRLDAIALEQVDGGAGGAGGAR